MSENQKIVADVIIKPMVDMWEPPVNLGKAPNKDADSEVIERYKAKRATILASYYDDLLGFDGEVLTEAFRATRLRAETHQMEKDPSFRPRWPASTMFRQEAQRISRDQRERFESGQSFEVDGVKYFPVQFTKRKWDMWTDWQKIHWRELSFDGQEALKKYFFKEYVQHTRETGREPANALAIIGSGVLAHFQMEFGTHAEACAKMKPEAREFAERILNSFRGKESKVAAE